MSRAARQLVFADVRSLRDQILDDARIALAEFDAGLRLAVDGGELSQGLDEARAALVDRILTALWAVYLPPRPPLALLAVGGYGRGELAPYSDVDLLLLTDEYPQPPLRRAIEALIASLWDLGLEPQTQVLTANEALALARGDLKTATRLLELRPLDGARALIQRLQAGTQAPDYWPAAQFLQARLDERRERHQRYFDTAYNLEPNLKDGRGGLRDFDAAIWVCRRSYDGSGLDATVRHRLLSAHERNQLASAVELVKRIRVGLHAMARRREDRLLFDYQKPLASAFGCADQPGANLAVEQFMQRYFRAATCIDRLSSQVIGILGERLLAPRRSAGFTLDADFEQHHELLHARHDQVFDDPLAIFRALRWLQERPGLRGVSANTERLVRAAVARIDDGFRQRADVRKQLIERLQDLRRLAEVYGWLNRWGVLAAYLPAFERIVGRMQYDLFHVYTVDEHTLRLVRLILGFAEPDVPYPRVHELYQSHGRPWLLALAALFHDIAKGQGGDHSQLGDAEARRFARSHGLDRDETELLAFLVREHLTLSMTAQRKDLSDPEVIAAFAAGVGDVERLESLYLLTVADINATSPKLWNGFKAGLLVELYERTAQWLKASAPPPTSMRALARAHRRQARLKLLAQGLSNYRLGKLWRGVDERYFAKFKPREVIEHTRWRAAHGDRLIEIEPDARLRTARVVVLEADRQGVFAALVATLDRAGLNIVHARVGELRSGLVLDSFEVLDPEGLLAQQASARQALVAALRRAIVRLPEIPRPPRRRPAPQLRHFRKPSVIELRDLTAQSATELDLITPDRPGLLADLARVLHELHIGVVEARIATMGERAEDVFVIRDQHGLPLSETLAATLVARLTAELDRDLGD